jgi:hypothetical protein
MSAVASAAEDLRRYPGTRLPLAVDAAQTAGQSD